MLQQCYSKGSVILSLENPKYLEKSQYLVEKVFKVYWSGGTLYPLQKKFFIADMDELEHAKKNKKKL